MPFVDYIARWAKRFPTYLLGKGFISLAVIAAATVGAATGFGVVLPAAAVALLGTGFTCFRRIQAQGDYENTMVAMYRDEIAAQMGIRPEDVGRAQLHEAAQHNEVIKQALDRQQRKTVVAIATAIAAGFATFALVSTGLVEGGWISKIAAGMGEIGQFISVGSIAGLSSLIVHDGLEAVIGEKTGIARAAAHDRIYAMERYLAHGRSVTPEQVFSVLVAAHPDIDQRVRGTFGKSFSRMGREEKSQALETMGLRDAMQEVADALNNREIRPSRLAYLMSDAIRERASRSEVSGETAAAPSRSFAERVSSRSREGSFADQILNERAQLGALGKA